MMNSQMNNTSDNQEQVFQEDSFRPVCFDKSSSPNSGPPGSNNSQGQSNRSSGAGTTGAEANAAAAAAAAAAATATSDVATHVSQVPLSLEAPVSSTPYKRNSSSAGSSVPSCSDHAKRAKLDPSLTLHLSSSTTLNSNTAPPFDNMPLPKSYTNDMNKMGPISPSSATAPSTKSKPPKFIRRFRSRSLPIINYNSQRSHFHHHHHPLHHLQKTSNTSTNSSAIPPLPPINLQSLKEIDLHEILKNPQLRHDILFDPQLQFRPNLDGERGKRKKSIIDKYWLEVQKECLQFFNPSSTPTVKINRLPILFTTVRDILLSLLPTKDRQQVNEIMDIDLLIQQLNHGSFDFVEMSKWLGEVFKSHCAPMRDQWVIEMHQKFVDAYNLNSVEYLVGGLRMIFQILEAMKLDVANHQIRLLRPVLIETAVDFERDYFQTLINHQKININDSLNWFYKKFSTKSNVLTEVENEDFIINDSNLKPIIISSIIDLLSCRQMATEFPSTLAFDHTRLVLLRADVRQLVCVQLCIVLYKQLLFSSNKANPKPALLSAASILKVQQEILAIVTDDNGNIKWTKNISAISLQLVKNVCGSASNLPSDMVDFSYNWLIKHIQPSSEVYGLMEAKIFKDLLTETMSTANDEPSLAAASSTSTLNNTPASSTFPSSTTTTTPPTSVKKDDSNSELRNIATRIATLVKFHWNVFGNYYIDYIKLQHHKIQQDKISKRNIIINNNKKKLIGSSTLSRTNEEDNKNKNQNGSDGLNPATILTI